VKKPKNGLDGTPTYTCFPREHWTRIRTNNGIERIMREIKPANAGGGPLSENEKTGQETTSISCLYFLLRSPYSYWDELVFGLLPYHSPTKQGVSRQVSEDVSPKRSFGVCVPIQSGQAFCHSLIGDAKPDRLM
jgi:hypothetical protein